MPEESVLVLFTKPPRPGRVKTRLIGAARGQLDAQEAAALHWAFVLDQLERLEGGAFDLRIAWGMEPGEPAPDVGIPSFRQHGSSLGERLWHGLSLAAETASRVAAVGSDQPELTHRQVEDAFDRLLTGSDVVLGPAADGGYYLLAVASEKLDRRLFEGIPWSTGSVRGHTLSRCRELGLVVSELAQARDVDTPADLARLAMVLRSGQDGCRRTRQLLASWGLLGE